MNSPAAPGPKPQDASYRYAVESDASLLARMNRDLIQDEGHRNKMTIPELAQRMSSWLRSAEYQAVLFECAGQAVGYALFRRDADDVYLRQFFIRRDQRRQGRGRAALRWLRLNAWAQIPRVRVDVLVGNAAGQAFWQAVGFRAYCLTMEMESGGTGL